MLAAGRTLLAVPGSDPARAAGDRAGKLEHALELPEVMVQVGEPAFLAAVRDAAAAGRTGGDRLLVGRPRRPHDPPHRSSGRCSSRWASGTSTRTATGPAPSECFASIAFARCARPASSSRSRPATRSATCSPPHPTIHGSMLELDPSAAWVADAYPAESITTRSDGTLEVELAVSEPAWLDRLLVRLGPEARVIRPKSARGSRRRRRPPGARALSPGLRLRADRPTQRVMTAQSRGISEGQSRYPDTFRGRPRMRG